jgi:hypothetical protein
VLRTGEGRERALDLKLTLERSKLVPESAVDRGLRGVQRGQRLAAFAHVVELSTGQGRHHPSASVRRRHGHGRDPRRGQDAPRNRELKRSDHGLAHHRLPVERGQTPVGLEDETLESNLFLDGLMPEGERRHSHEFVELPRLDGPDLYVHDPMLRSKRCRPRDQYWSR